MNILGTIKVSFVAVVFDDRVLQSFALKADNHLNSEGYCSTCYKMNISL